jgi:hypothetical protein
MSFFANRNSVMSTPIRGPGSTSPTDYSLGEEGDRAVTPTGGNAQPVPANRRGREDFLGQLQAKSPRDNLRASAPHNSFMTESDKGFLANPANKRFLREARDESLRNPEVSNAIKANVIANDALRRSLEKIRSPKTDILKGVFRSGSSDPFERAAAHARQTIPTRTGRDADRVTSIIEQARQIYNGG